MTNYILQLATIFFVVAAILWLVFIPGKRPILQELALGLIIAATLTFLVAPAPAWAAEAADSRVNIPIGDLINELMVPVFALISAIIAWLIRRLPASIKAWIDTLRVEQLLDKAAAYGINSVAGAAKGQTLTVDVHLPVLAYMLRYALDRIPAALLKWVGGPTSLAEMIWARLDVDVKAQRPDLDTLASALASGSSVGTAVAAVKAAS